MYLSMWLIASFYTSKLMIFPIYQHCTYPVYSHRFFLMPIYSHSLSQASFFLLFNLVLHTTIWLVNYKLQVSSFTYTICTCWLLSLTSDSEKFHHFHGILKFFLDEPHLVWVLLVSTKNKNKYIFHRVGGSNL